MSNDPAQEPRYPAIVELPDALLRTWGGTPEGMIWLRGIPGLVLEAADRWNLDIGDVFDEDD